MTKNADSPLGNGDDAQPCSRTPANTSRESRRVDPTTFVKGWSYKSVIWNRMRAAVS